MSLQIFRKLSIAFALIFTSLAGVDAAQDYDIQKNVHEVTKYENNNLRRAGVILIRQQGQYLEEDEKFWFKHFQHMLSTPFPTAAPTSRTPLPPTPPFPTPTPPFPTPTPPTPTITLPPSNGQFPTTPPPAITPTPPSPVTRPPSFVVCDGISQLERAQQLTDIAIGASGSINTGSPQDIALEWLIQTDPYFVCPDDPKALQRYILAVFYFSTDGDNWNECSRPESYDSMSIDEANDNCSVRTTPIAGGQLNPSFLPTTEGTFAWLTPVYECEWAGITCRVETTCVDRIEFGK